MIFLQRKLKMKYRVFVSLRNGILDPEAEEIKKTIKNLGYDNIKNLSRGKYFDIEMNNVELDSNEEKISSISSDLLANPVIENFKIIKLKS
ncbi:MAG: phosphoribosylformylglycinamidine synthase [Rickettsiales bacterium]|nr:phosphoribosylformylglycinamidine synthase [Rickettsiales bacterium]